jgi:beta-glucosidase
MAIKKTLPVQFPKRFLWGAATSAHQVEGNTHNQWTVWELENAKSLAKQAEYKLKDVPVWEGVKDQASDPENYVSGQATDHYNLYEKDFDIVKAMHLNAFRFSIEWSRIEPTKGNWDPAEIQHYREYLQALNKRGIEPVVTLMHWTLPTWFTDMGGFEKRANVRHFVRFAQKIFEEFGQEFRLVCTLNEPEVYVAEGWIEGIWPPSKRSKFTALRVYTNLAYAHRQIYKLAHRTNRRLKVGLSKDIAHHYRGDDALSTKLMVAGAQYVADYFFLNRVRRSLDWLGINYYFTNKYQGFKRVPSDAPLNDLGWEMEPQNLQFVLERIYKKYKTPIIVTENGVADREDKHRKWWISHSISAMYKAMKNGVKLDGYLHWSLLDNFEWAYGKWPNFGLVKVDYKTMKRSPRASAIWLAKLVKELRGISK